MKNLKLLKQKLTDKATDIERIIGKNPVKFTFKQKAFSVLLATGMFMSAGPMKAFANENDTDLPQPTAIEQTVDTPPVTVIDLTTDDPTLVGEVVVEEVPAAPVVETTPEVVAPEVSNEVTTPEVKEVETPVQNTPVTLEATEEMPGSEIEGSIIIEGSDQTVDTTNKDTVDGVELPGKVENVEDTTDKETNKEEDKIVVDKDKAEELKNDANNMQKGDSIKEEIKNNGEGQVVDIPIIKGQEDTTLGVITLPNGYQAIIVWPTDGKGVDQAKEALNNAYLNGDIPFYPFDANGNILGTIDFIGGATTEEKTYETEDYGDFTLQRMYDEQGNYVGMRFVFDGSKELNVIGGSSKHDPFLDPELPVIKPVPSTPIDPIIPIPPTPIDPIQPTPTDPIPPTPEIPAGKTPGQIGGIPQTGDSVDLTLAVALAATTAALATLYGAKRKLIASQNFGNKAEAYADNFIANPESTIVDAIGLNALNITASRTRSLR